MDFIPKVRNRKRREAKGRRGPFVFLRSLDMLAVHRAFTFHCLGREVRSAGRGLTARDEKFLGVYKTDILHMLEYASGIRVTDHSETVSLAAVLRFCRFVRCHPLQVFRYPVIRAWDGDADHEPEDVSLISLQGRWDE